MDDLGVAQIMGGKHRKDTTGTSAGNHGLLRIKYKGVEPCVSYVVFANIIQWWNMPLKRVYPNMDLPVHYLGINTSKPGWLQYIYIYNIM